MLTKLRTLTSLYRELGFRWSAFRVAYAFRLRTGLVRLQMPQYKWTDRPLETWLKKGIPSDPEAYAKWRKQNQPNFFFRKQLAGRVAEGISRPSEIHANLPWNPQTAVIEANRVLNGEIKYFSHDFVQTGFPPNWHQIPNSLLEAASPGTAAGAEAIKHWSQISDDANIDIKFIWEPNRFSFIYTLVRAYAASQDEKFAEAFWQSILDWAEHNPPNTGPNWMDGQEIALRLMAWTFGYYTFLTSSSTTPQHIAKFTQYVAAQAERIYKNIDYAISTRSNHTISEAFGLWLIGLLFPELSESEKIFSLGRALLEREAAAQIFPDGSYSMYSLNYHRFILHIYLYAIRLGEINNSPFPTQLVNSVSKSVEYLSHLLSSKIGEMPVYGSNDGAFVLPFNNCDFTDYRPLLQLGWYITQGERLFEPGPWDEDVYWLFGAESPAPVGSGGRGEEESFTAKPTKSAKQIKNLDDLRNIIISSQSFPNGGIYLLRSTRSHALIRCTDFTSRPSHADQLHVDLWIHGQNIACDAGTYLYNGEGIWRNGLAHTSTHNTVTVDGKDQMTMVSRFTWTNWSKGKVLQHNEKLWQGEHDSYKPVSHKRTVMALDGDRWLVVDHLTASEPHHYALHWLLSDGDFGVQELATAHALWLTPTKTDSKLSDSKFLIQMGLIEGNGNFSLIHADPNSTRGWRSRYYGHKEPAISVMLEANQPQVTFWSFFGLESDVVEIEGNALMINSKKIPLVE